MFHNVRMPLMYWEWEHDGAPLAILIHGSRDHSRSWDAIASTLQRRYRVVAPDLRGHGDSAWSQDGRYNYAAYLSDLAALCDTLDVSQEHPAVLIGHSLGAHIALRFTGAMPELVTRLIALEAIGAPAHVDVARTAMSTDAQLRTWFGERRAAAIKVPRLFTSVAEAADRMLSKHDYLTPDQALHLTTHGVRRQDSGWCWKYDPYLSVWPYPELEQTEAETLWCRIDSPVLAIFGERSWPSPVPGRLVGLLSDVHEVRLPSSGHWPHHDSIDSCLDAMSTFLGVPRPS